MVPAPLSLRAARSATARLRRLVERRASELRDAALEDDTRVTQEDTARLARLQQLLTALQTTEPRSRWLRWTVPAVAGAAVLIVTALLALTVSSTEIELDLTATEVAFTLPERETLIDHAALAELGASGLGASDVGGLVTTTSAAARADVDATSVRLSAQPQAGAWAAGTIDVARWVFPSGTRVWLSTTARPQTYRVSIEGADAELTASVKGTITVARPGMKAATVSLAIPRPARLQTSATTLADFDLTVGHGGGIALSPQLNAKQLSFARVEPFADTARQTPVRALSTVVGGTLFMESLNGARHELRAGQALRH